MDSAVEDTIPPQDQGAEVTAPPIYTRKAGARGAVAEPPPLYAPTIEAGSDTGPWLPGTATSPTSEQTGRFDLPQTPPVADLPRGALKARWVLLIFGLTLLV